MDSFVLSDTSVSFLKKRDKRQKEIEKERKVDWMGWFSWQPGVKISSCESFV